MPFLRLEITTENNVIKFTIHEDQIRAEFSRWHAQVVHGFKELIHPDYVKIVTDESSTGGNFNHMD